VKRAAVWLASLAVVLSAAALVASLDQPSPLARFPLTCGESFSANGTTVPVYYPCRRGRP
jgi:hypothetical protein